MKILYRTAVGFDTPNPNNQMAEVMINDFLDNGHTVHLIQSRSKGINPDIPASLLGREGFSCDTVDSGVIDKTRFVKRYLHDIAYAFKSMRYWRRVKDADVIYLQSYPAIIFPMVLLKLFCRLPIVYSIYDVFPGHAYDIGVIKSKLIFDTLRLIQKPCYRMSTAITVLSEDMKQKVVEQGARPESVFVVPAWYDVKSAREIPRGENRFLKKFDIPGDKFYVQFAGTIGYVFDYKAVIELARRIKHDDSIEIHIIGDGNVKEAFVAEAEANELSNIRFFPLQPVELVPDVYSACDLCFIPLRRGVIGNGVPSKAPILMACRRAIINSVEIDSGYAKMFAENDMGVSVDIGNYDELAEAVLRLRYSPEELSRMADNAYEYGKNNYSSAESTAKLMSIFEQVKKKRKKK